MHILYLCADWNVDVLGRSGSSVHVRQMCETFASLGHRVTLCCVNAGGHAPLSKQVQLHVFAPKLRLRERVKTWLPRPGAHPVESPSQWTGGSVAGPLSPLRSVATALDYAARRMRLWQFRRMVLNVLGDQSVDLVYERVSLFSLAGPKLGKVLHAPALVEFNAPLALELPARGRLFKRALLGWETAVLASSDAAICVSQQLADYLLDGHPFASRKLHVVPNGVAPILFNPTIHSSSLRSQLGLNGKTVVGFVGTMKAWHDIATLIGALGIASAGAANLCLLAVGDGPRRLEFERQSQLCGIEAIFVGAVDYEQIPDYISVMDIVVAPHPKLATFYFSPIKVFEYMCMAKPVIASSVGQLAEVIEDGVTGILVPPADPAALAKAIVALCQSPRLRRRLGEAAHDWVSQSHTWETTAREVLSIAKSAML